MRPAVVRCRPNEPTAQAAPAALSASSPRADGDNAAGDAVRAEDVRTVGCVPITDAAVREGYAELLGRYDWDVFATLTYGGRVWCPEKVERNFRSWIFRWQEQTAEERCMCSVSWRRRTDGYGRVVGQTAKRRGTWWNAYRAGRAFPTWVLGIEAHRSGLLHAHAIIRWSRALPDLRWRLGHELWRNPKSEGGFGHGLNRVVPPKNCNHVAGYVAKYVVKGGDLVFSPSFDAARLAAD